MTREHYSMIEIDSRLLPAVPVQRFAALIPLYGQNFSLPETPGENTRQTPAGMQNEMDRCKIGAP